MGTDQSSSGTTPSLAQSLAEWAGSDPERAALAAVVEAVAGTAIRLAAIVAVHPLRASGTRPGAGSAAVANPSGDVPTALDLFAEKMFVEALAGQDVLAVCSEESTDPIAVDGHGRFVVGLDPVDGSSNTEVNAPVGTIFSVLRSLPGVDAHAAVMRPGREQLAAGLVVFGPATLLVLTVGDGTDVFAVDPRTRDFRLVRRRIRLPEDSREYAINAANGRHWGPGVSAYVGDLVRGADGPRGRDVNMRWTASLVAEAYRILTRGGIFLYPADGRPGYSNGRIRLVYEANPVAALCEQAGGTATDGVVPILDLHPSDLHQRVPFVFGSRDKVERVRRYLTEPQGPHERSPLFGSRGLLRH